MVPGQRCPSDRVGIGDRRLIGKGAASSATSSRSVTTSGPPPRVHHRPDHGYEDLGLPISRQVMPERPVVVGAGSWLGYGTVVLPGARIGRHVVVGANSVVVGDLPDHCVAVGTPARVIRRHVEGEGWKPVP
jgi:acetyltransferase-like isoleucine patch superfamily enzyme